MHPKNSSGGLKTAEITNEIAGRTVTAARNFVIAMTKVILYPLKNLKTKYRKPGAYPEDK
jgi:hypothetical protein